MYAIDADAPAHNNAVGLGTQEGGLSFEQQVYLRVNDIDVSKNRPPDAPDLPSIAP